MSDFMSRKLWATVAVVLDMVGMMIASYLTGFAYITQYPFIAGVMLTYMIYVFAQGVLDFNKVSMKFGSLDIAAGPDGSAYQDKGFMSRKFVASVVMFVILNVMRALKLIDEIPFVAGIESVYLIWIFAQGVIDINRFKFNSEFFKIDNQTIPPAVVADPVPVVELPKAAEVPAPDTATPIADSANTPDAPASVQ